MLWAACFFAQQKMKGTFDASEKQTAFAQRGVRIPQNTKCHIFHVTVTFSWRQNCEHEGQVAFRQLCVNMTVITPLFPSCATGFSMQVHFNVNCRILKESTPWTIQGFRVDFRHRKCFISCKDGYPDEFTIWAFELVDVGRCFEFDSSDRLNRSGLEMLQIVLWAIETIGSVFTLTHVKSYKKMLWSCKFYKVTWVYVWFEELVIIIYISTYNILTCCLTNPC